MTWLSTTEDFSDVNNSLGLGMPPYLASCVRMTAACDDFVEREEEAVH